MAVVRVEAGWKKVKVVCERGWLLAGEGEEKKNSKPARGSLGCAAAGRNKSGGPWLSSENNNQGPRGMEAIFDQEPAAGLCG